MDLIIGGGIKDYIKEVDELSLSLSLTHTHTDTHTHSGKTCACTLAFFNHVTGDLSISYPFPHENRISLHTRTPPLGETYLAPNRGEASIFLLHVSVVFGWQHLCTSLFF